MKTSPQNRGFTLVETALAFGLVAFALTSLLGLISISLNSGKDSAQDTLFYAMANQVTSNLRAEYFASSSHPDGAANVLAGTALSGTTTLPPIYFDDTGVLLTSRSNAVYQCTPVLVSDTNTLTSSGSNSTYPVNMVNVTLHFAWPVPAISVSDSNSYLTAPHAFAFSTSIARY